MKQTYLNLAQAYVGESQARNRYTFYASIARKEGYEQLAEVFTVTAAQEKEHASNLFKLIDKLHHAEEGLDTLVLSNVEVPNVRGTTIQNLTASIKGETHEFTEMYPSFADVADDEGYPAIAEKMRAIAKAEENHADIFSQFLKLLKSDTFFKRTKPQNWVCRECGYLHQGTQPPQSCPSCEHPPSYYELKRSY